MKNKHNKQERIISNKNRMPVPTRTMDPPINIIDQAKEIESAEEIIKVNVHGKLDVIVKQIKALKKEAKKIINDAYEDMKLHKAQCNFEKKIGEIIYLYKKEDNLIYFSRLSPEDWNNHPPHHFLGAYIFMADRSFKKIK